MEDVSGVGCGGFEDVTLRLLILSSLWVRESVAPSSPPPLITTGSKRLERKSSRSRFEWLNMPPLLLATDCGILRVVLVDLVRVPLLLALGFLPRWPYFPYPSWPVPAAGPLRISRAVSAEPSSMSVLDCLGKRPRRFAVAVLSESVFPCGDSLVSVLGSLRDNRGEPVSREGIRDTSLERTESTEVAADALGVGLDTLAFRTLSADSRLLCPVDLR